MWASPSVAAEAVVPAGGNMSKLASLNIGLSCFRFLLRWLIFFLISFIFIVFLLWRPILNSINDQSIKKVTVQLETYGISYYASCSHARWSTTETMSYEHSVRAGLCCCTCYPLGGHCKYYTTLHYLFMHRGIRLFIVYSVTVGDWRVAATPTKLGN